MQRITSFDGRLINVRRDGSLDAPAVVLSHYLGGGISSWDSLTETLREHFCVIRFDTRGHGESDAPSESYSIETLGRDALAVIDAFKLRTAAFVGLSQGGMTGMWLAIHHGDRISRLVIANSAPFIPNKPVWNQHIHHALTEGLAGVIEPMIVSWLTEDFKARAAAEVRQAVALATAMSPDGFAGNCAVLRDIDLRSMVGTIACPTLLIAGAEDGPRGAAMHSLATQIPGATLTVIPQAAHLTHLENPAVFNAAVREFLS